ncbi:hypothetical protein, partial [Nocardia cyriacigeorgica]|uniref:hypothetical protein n=1 Tax=Nocardia cyriacigeorgica TaxID=135487 RepID=UPI0024537A7C
METKVVGGVTGVVRKIGGRALCFGDVRPPLSGLPIDDDQLGIGDFSIDDVSAVRAFEEEYV